MKRVMIAVAVLAVAGGGYRAYKSRAARAAKGEKSRPVVVEVEDLQETVDATGSVAPNNRVEIKPPVAGRVETLLVDEGDRVKAGQIVAWLSSTDRAAILDAARAQGPEEFKKWQDAYKPTPVVASLPGEVILRNVVVGEAVATGTTLFAVADTLIVNAQVDEADIGKVSVGQKASIRLDSYPDQPVAGKVVDVLYEGKNVSNVITYGVKVRPDRVPPFFRSQMTANVSFVIRAKPGALVLPANAVRDTKDGRRVVRLPPPSEGGEPVEREVKTGIEADDKVEIVEGLQAGDKVLVANGRYVPQTAPASSPLSFTSGRGMGRSDGAAPRQRRTGAAAASAPAVRTP
ncbi:MAG: efflux RND transporter periplasmic adaptor subunit [Elusimicrobiota bacterium]|nr:efflux RND transporter periplasmic adaptor subunit [Elusimicrobiota bacterium]